MLEKILHFCKEFPAWIVLVILFVVLLIRFPPTDPRFTERITDAVLVALFTALSLRPRPSSPDNSTAIENVGEIKISPENPDRLPAPLIQSTEPESDSA